MSKRRAHVLTHILLVLICFLIIVPIYWVVKTSLTGENLFNYPPSLIPKDPHLYFFVDVYYWIPFLRFFMNSVIVSAIVVVSNIIFNAMAGFALGYNFPGKKIIILTYLSCMMVPFQTTIIPAFLLTKYFGLLNTHLGLALPLVSTIINIFVFKTNFDAVPHSLHDAARIDGMADWRMLFRIYLPLARPAIATNIILTFVWSWNNFIWPLIITQDTIMRTLPLGLARFLSYFEDTSGQLYAFVIMVIAPIVVVFLMNQRSFISGMMSGAVKG